MKLPSKIPTEELDKLFGIVPDPNQEPMSNAWRKKQIEQQTRYKQATSQWLTEKDILYQEEFLLKRDVVKRRSKNMKHTK
jgi:hypothetical protein